LTVPDGVWTFVALVVTASNATLYMQPAGGAMQSAVNATANAAQAFSGVSYVGQDTLGGRFFNGSLDDIRVYNTSLSGAQVTQLYNSYFPPTIATAAAASPATVSGTTSTLSALGASNLGESALTYTWAAIGTPPGPVAFSVNGTNAAKSTVATFSKAGTYTLGVTIFDTYGQNVTSSATVTVDQTLSSIVVNPASVSLNENGTQQFTATANDQFGAALPSQPTFNWSASDGTVDSTGLYTAPFANGSFQIAATSGATSGSAMANVTILAGDLDGDGQRTVADVGTFTTALADIPTYEGSYNLSPSDALAACNLDGDGAVTNLDLQAMIVLLANSGGGSLAPASASSAPTSFAATASASMTSDRQLSPSDSIGSTPFSAEAVAGSSPADFGQVLPSIGIESLNGVQSAPANGRSAPLVAVADSIGREDKNDDASARTSVILSHVDDNVRPTTGTRSQPLNTDHSSVPRLATRNRWHDILARDEIFSGWPSMTTP
jgi:hypothetical protein